MERRSLSLVPSCRAACLVHAREGFTDDDRGLRQSLRSQFYIKRYNYQGIGYALKNLLRWCRAKRAGLPPMLAWLRRVPVAAPFVIWNDVTIVFFWIVTCSADGRWQNAGENSPSARDSDSVINAISSPAWHAISLECMSIRSRTEISRAII